MIYSYDKQIKEIVCKPGCAEECLAIIFAIGADYDGYEDAKDLKRLIDNLVDLAQEARTYMVKGKIYPDEDEDDITFAKASADASVDRGE